MSTPIEIKAVKREVVKSVGDATTFEANCSAIAGHAKSLELAIMGALAYAFYVFHKAEGDDRFAGVNRMRNITGLHAGLAVKLNQALTAITRSKVEDAKSVRDVALAFASETTASMFHFETKRKADAKQKAQESRLKKLADEKKAIDAKIKAAKEEGKKEAEDATQDVMEYTLIGEGGHVEPLTQAEHMALAMHLVSLRQEEALAANMAASEKVQAIHNRGAQRRANVADKVGAK